MRELIYSAVFDALNWTENMRVAMDAVMIQA